MSISDRHKLSGVALVFVVFASVPILTLAGLTQTKIKAGFNLFSPKQDIEIGSQSAVEAERQLPLLSDTRSADYVNRLG